MDSREIAATLTWLMFFAAMIASTGCRPESNRLATDEAPKANTLTYVHLDHAVHFAGGSATLASGEAKALAEFVATSNPGYGDEVSVAAADSGEAALQRRRRESIERQLKRLGVKPAEADHGGSASTAGGDVLVRVGRYVVTPPHCPDWSAPDGSDFTNTPGSNFGCATATNLGLMVANPADLVRGTPGGGADADNAARAIDRYRLGLRRGLTAQAQPPSGTGSGGDSSGGGGQGNGQ